MSWAEQRGHVWIPNVDPPYMKLLSSTVFVMEDNQTSNITQCNRLGPNKPTLVCVVIAPVLEKLNLL